MSKLNLSELLLGLGSKAPSKEPDCVVIVRLLTSYYKTKTGLAYRKELRFLMRKCKGHNFLEEDVSIVGAEETISRILNLNEMKDGIYKVIIVNEKRDWETGYVDDYDFLLVEYNP